MCIRDRVYPHPRCSEDYRLPHLLQEEPVHPELVYSVLPAVSYTHLLKLLPHKLILRIRSCDVEIYVLSL